MAKKPIIDVLWKEGNPLLRLKEEIDFLNLLGLGWVEPKDRRPGLRYA